MNATDHNATLVKACIANAFSKAAESYDKHAQFQRNVCDIVLSRLPDQLNGYRILDLGCGTGYLAKNLSARGAQVVCVDLSEKMLAKAREQIDVENAEFICADAESLPLGDNQFDYVVSSLALQWCDDIAIPLKEAKRVLKVDGEVHFTTLVDGSLEELRWSWAQVDQHQHVNTFKSFKTIKVALAQSAIENHQLDLRKIVVWYESAISLMKDLKGIGANHVHKRRRGLAKRNALMSVESQYQNFLGPGGFLPATYLVCIGVIRR
ncbi:malonyl-ACP O-methyltransferase BioC [Vibrio sp.]|uniref:Malonyl-[acyl-carrier protein] O-methyltransferase n=1 Tax=Vibrio viridaestus TaxID=2487322 RepID=A0A3N9TYI0_9VIBR|nr:malonyl-ACP O-methyltransferase BioC [Vibrio viridaestus]MDC0609514.1 malonyl-ACP O-methyltransferase BioC [Vibrio sp.]RQW61992.1 malonyl-[acyl-carrier protein] O-methyltransferase BioC [Vibrio viridaestus]